MYRGGNDIFRWKTRERQTYLNWVEKIVYSRADAIVGGQHRRQYAQVAVLLAAVGEVKESIQDTFHFSGR